MISNKRGAISYEQIILFILAIVVLLVVVAFFTGTFERVKQPVNATIGQLDKAIECNQLCSTGTTASYQSFCDKECYAVSGISCTRATDSVVLTAEGCSR